MDVDPAKLQVPVVQETDLRSVFLGEASVFTPWLARPENLDRLAAAIGMRLEPIATEQSTGSFRIDLVARSVEDDTRVVIENQFGASDHDHFGKALTYLAATADDDAKTVIWLAERFRDEHKAVLNWLNDNTPEDISFFGVVPKLLKIGDGPPGLRFDVLIKPNRVIKQVRATEKKLDPFVTEMRTRYWPVFESTLRADPDCSGVVTKFGSRSGFMHLFPDARFALIQPSTHCLVYLQVPASGQCRTGLWIRPNPDQAPEWRERIEQLRAGFRKAFDEGGFGPETEQFDSNSDFEQVAAGHLKRAKAVLRALQMEFAPEAAAASDGV